MSKPDRITATADRAQLIVSGKQLDEQSDSALEELLIVDAGSDVHANDELFAVLSFPQTVWVIPELTLGANALFFDAWRAHLANFHAIYRARIDTVPRAWRARTFGIPMPRPKLGAFAKDSVPSWTHKAALSFADVPRIGSDR